MLLSKIHTFSILNLGTYKPVFRCVDSADNEILAEGDHFLGKITCDFLRIGKKIQHGFFRTVFHCLKKTIKKIKIMAELTHNDLPQAVEEILKIVQYIVKLMQDNDGSKNKDELADRWLNVRDLLEYLPTHPSLSDIYAKTHNRTIPFHKSGKRILFRKFEIDTWLLSNQSKTLKQMTEKAEKIMISKHNSRRRKK
jgi:excisionase family DNA binding protein